MTLLLIGLLEIMIGVFSFWTAKKKGIRPIKNYYGIICLVLGFIFIFAGLVELFKL